MSRIMIVCHTNIIFHDFVNHHKKLTRDRDDFYHKPFLNSLRDHQKAFVRTRLDGFYATGKDPISNIDDLMKTKDSERTKTSRANGATTTTIVADVKLAKTEFSATP
ncbi:hypothetical protein I7I48_00825 [Histoplasma ohiense]|nr:hypothetical protein I7I48_00825 [Histoplasma ohiense (nom. inval.)]